MMRCDSSTIVRSMALLVMANALVSVLLEYWNCCLYASEVAEAEMDVFSDGFHDAVVDGNDVGPYRRGGITTVVKMWLPLDMTMLTMLPTVLVQSYFTTGMNMLCNESADVLRE